MTKLTNNKFIEIANSESEQIIITEIFKSLSLEMNDVLIFEEVNFKSLNLKYKKVFLKKFLKELSKLKQPDFDKISTYIHDFIHVQVWPNERYFEDISNLDFIRSYLDETPAQCIADSISYRNGWDGS